eukprot:1524637-Prymnesium_polylepis.1
MLPSGRRRAGRSDVGALPTARAFDLTTAERVFRHRLGVKDCHKTPSPVIAHALLRLARAPAPSHGWLRGRSNFGLNPLALRAGVAVKIYTKDVRAPGRALE